MFGLLAFASVLLVWAVRLLRVGRTLTIGPYIRDAEVVMTIWAVLLVVLMVMLVRRKQGEPSTKEEW